MIEILCPKITDIDDQAILLRVPEKVIDLLGKQDGTGYDLRKDQRDIFFENGVVKYQPNGTKILVYLDS